MAHFTHHFGKMVQEPVDLSEPFQTYIIQILIKELTILPSQVKEQF